MGQFQLQHLFQHQVVDGSVHCDRLRSGSYGSGSTHLIDNYLYERQGSELHMVKKEEGKEKQQSTGPESATSRSITDPLAAEP